MLKATARKPIDIVQLKLRLREELRRKLEREAAKNGHSLNTEMVERLEASFTAESQTRERERLVNEIKGEVKTTLEANASNVVDILESFRHSIEQLREPREGLQHSKKEGRK